MVRYYGPIVLLAMLLFATATCTPHLTPQHAEVNSRGGETSDDSSS